MRLTDKTAAGLRGKSKSYKVTCDRCPGLTLRVHPSGTRTWYIRKTVDLDGVRQRVEIKLGRHPAMTCAQARLEFHQQTAIVEDGLARAVSAARTRAKALEVGQLVGMYLDDLAPMISQVTLDGYRSTVGAFSDMQMHRTHCASLSKQRAKAWFRELMAMGYSRGYCTKLIRLHAAALDWGSDEGLVNTPNHFKSLMRREVRRIPKRPKRSRVLTDDELRAVWNFKGFERNRIKWLEATTILRLLILTGLRCSEIRCLEWADVGAGEQHVAELGETFPLILIPAERTKTGLKTGRGYSVPLLEPIREVLLDYAARVGGKRTGQIFPLMHKAAINAVLHAIKRQGATHTIHDIRRTVSTRLSVAGVPREYIEAVLQHSNSGRASDHYIHHAFIGQKVRALNRWFELLAPVLNTPPKSLAAPGGDLLGGDDP